MPSHNIPVFTHLLQEYVEIPPLAQTENVPGGSCHSPQCVKLGDSPINLERKWLFLHDSEHPIRHSHSFAAALVAHVNPIIYWTLVTHMLYCLLQ